MTNKFTMTLAGAASTISTIVHAGPTEPLSVPEAGATGSVAALAAVAAVGAIAWERRRRRRKG